MTNNTFYSQILLDHHMHPSYKEKIDDPTMVLEGQNPSCGDDIWLMVKMNGDVIEDAGFQGSGCAISQASVDMMLELVIGKTKKEALELSALFMRMIAGEAEGDELEDLEEAVALKDIAHMPARVKCAVLGWRTLNEMLEKI